ncbi:MAG: exodeoxyribonuclease VII small subunit [Thermodesulfobacteriota bacterium]|nr:exodeoxyribonuclease VII small subunit [Thermodesulfobacteriota bacterium]
MAKPTFEDAMKRLEDIVQELEAGTLSLDEALKTFQEGIKLSKFCAKKLDEAERKVSVLLQDDAGTVRSEPFQEERPKVDAET